MNNTNEIVKFKTSLMEGVFVEVPENVTGKVWLHMNQIWGETDSGFLNVHQGEEVFSREQMLETLDARYQIFCQTSSITESEAAQVVDQHGWGDYRNYIDTPGKWFLQRH